MIKNPKKVNKRKKIKSDIKNGFFQKTRFD